MVDASRAAPATSRSTGKARPPDLNRKARFQDLFRSELPFVCRTLARLGARASDIEDLAQDVFLKIYQNLDAYDPTRPLRPWVFAFCFHAASNHRRLARHAREAPALDHEASDREASPEDSDLVLQALRRMTLDHRAVLVMHHIEGFSAPEMSQILEVPLNTVYSRLRLARSAFEKAVSELDPSNGEGDHA